MARPSTFNTQIADEICKRLAGGESLLSICKNEEMPSQAAVFQWLMKHAEFQENYARARQYWAQAEFERMMEITDTPMEGEKTEEGVNEKGSSFIKTIRGDMIEHRRLQVDTRKWALARMFPKVYGDRIQNQVSGPDGEALKIVVTGVPPTEENSR